MTEKLEREISSAHLAEATFQKQLFAEEQKILSLEAVAKEAQTLLEESSNRRKDLTAELEKLQQEVAVAKAVPQSLPIPPEAVVEDSEVVVTLRADIARLQNEREEFVRKFNTIEERYKSGDLVRSLLSRFHTL